VSPRTLSLREVRVGDALPELAIELTTSGIVAGAIASRDYQDVHHDADAARAQGMPNVFMNILTTNGYVGRFVTDWAGPEARLQKVAIRLGAPNLPGDTMRMKGTVVAAERRPDHGAVEVEVVGANAYGDHVTGTVHLTLPLESLS
jgi:acyl dehydratase